MSKTSHTLLHKGHLVHNYTSQCQDQKNQKHTHYQIYPTDRYIFVTTVVQKKHVKRSNSGHRFLLTLVSVARAKQEDGK